MPGGIFSHKDSLGKCDYPSHLYGSFSNTPPTTKIKTHSIPQIRDVLESSQKKVDMDVELTFQTVGKSGILFFIGQAGKYLFLVAVFPPYFIVYAIPKWLAKELLPKVIAEVQKMWEKGTLLLIDLALWGGNKMSPIKRFYGNFQAKTRKMSERVREFFQRRKKGLEAGVKLIKEKSVDPIAGFVQKISQTFSSFFSSGQGSIMQKFQNAFTGAVKKIRSISSQIKIYPQSLQTLFTRAKVLGKEVLRVVKTENLRTKEIAEKIVKKWKNSLQPYVETFIQKMQDVKVNIAHPFYLGASKIADFCSPKIQKTWSFLQNFTQTAKEKVQLSLNKFADWSRLAIQWGKIHLSPAYQILSNMAQNFLQFLPRTAVSWISGCKEASHRLGNQFQKTLHYLTLKSLSLKHKIVQAAESFYRFLKQFREKGKQAYHQAKKIAKAAIKKGVQITFRAIEKGTIFLIRLILWLRILLAWIRILSWYGMQLLPELTSRILEGVQKP